MTKAIDAQDTVAEAMMARGITKAQVDAMRELRDKMTTLADEYFNRGLLRVEMEFEWGIILILTKQGRMEALESTKDKAN